jgi:hypothetical protein
MSKVIIKEYTNRFWQVAEVYKDGKLIAKINRFYKVDENWIYIYGAVGGHDYHSQGELEEKIYIGDCEFELQKLTSK